MRTVRNHALITRISWVVLHTSIPALLTSARLNTNEKFDFGSNIDSGVQHGLFTLSPLLLPGYTLRISDVFEKPYCRTMEPNQNQNGKITVERRTEAEAEVDEERVAEIPIKSVGGSAEAGERSHQV